MGVTVLKGITVVTGAAELRIARLLTLRSALGLELKGLKHSRGSVYALVKKEFSLKGNKQKVYDQFNRIVEEAIKQHQQTG